MAASQPPDGPSADMRHDGVQGNALGTVFQLFCDKGRDFAGFLRRIDLCVSDKLRNFLILSQYVLIYSGNLHLIVGSQNS